MVKQVNKCKDILCKGLSFEYPQHYLQVTFHIGGWPSDRIQHHLVVSENRKEVECIVAGECGDCRPITGSPTRLQSDGNDPNHTVNTT